MVAGVRAIAVAMRECAHGMIETATTAGASTTAIATVVAASGTGMRTQLAEVRGTKSPRTVLRHHLPVRAEAAVVAGGQDLTPPMVEKSQTHETC